MRYDREFRGRRGIWRSWRGRGYTGPGEAGRYGDAPVEYGPDHTYDYHLGDRYGYGPDYLEGDRRVRRGQPPPAPRRRRGPRRGG